MDPSRNTRRVSRQKRFKQKYGIDYTETFLPVVKYVTLRMEVAITKYFDWTLDQLDVVTAFLYGEMKSRYSARSQKGSKLMKTFVDRCKA
uniref:Reverse transcriptase Ty1/copia-type domain-containing protein n=1 Tax=Peronospora matthiolae TaxID=2874970 RepID=A0AAV1UQN8_9STRA